GRVLVAEDSLETQAQLSAFLTGAGLEVVVARDGQQAIDQALASRFDLVIMDMEMPVLDGYAATRALRARGYSGVILALTAHAHPDDREKCLSAGCTGFLAKPDNWNGFLGVLATWLPPAGGHDAGCRPGVASLPVHGEQASFAALVREYVAGLPDRMAGLRAALVQSNWRQLARGAHQLKGSAAMYGFADVSETAGLVEAAVLEKQNTDLIEELTNELGQIVDRAVSTPSTEALAIVKPNP